MVQMKNISKEGNIIKMIVIPAGNQDDAFNIRFDVSNHVILESSKDDCLYYYAVRACDKIINLLKENESLPQEASIYWY